MTSWKLVAAAMKAQRTWANLSPEQKEQVRKKATQAARSAYARMQEPGQPEQARSAPAPTAPAPAPTVSDPAPPAPEPPPATAAAAAQSAAPARPATDALVGLARAHGPRLARQAATHALTRTQGRASQLVRLWQRTQRPSK